MNIHSAQPHAKDCRILSVNFNQDQGCFAVGHESGFLVYNTNPIDLRVKRNFSDGASGSGIGHVTMLHRTNYLALVGGGKNPKFSNNKVIIWDDLKRKISLSLEFMSPVLNVMLSRIRIIVVLKNQVLVYGFSAPPKKFATYETIDNEFGLADLSFNSSSSSTPISGLELGKDPKDLAQKFQTLAFPGRSIGQIQLVDVSPAGQEKNLVSIIKAHKSKIRCLALNRSGTLIASASETGTIIRIHSTYNTVLLYEFRRGLDRAVITSMKFSHNDTKLAVLSDKNTLHIYNVGPIHESELANNNNSSDDSSVFSKEHPINRQHLLKKLAIPIPIPDYFNSTWSFCSVNTNQYHTDGLSDVSNDVGVLGWSGSDSVIIIWKNRKIWERYTIVETPGTAAKNEHGTKSHSNWKVTRYSWKSLDQLKD